MNTIYSSLTELTGIYNKLSNLVISVTVLLIAICAISIVIRLITNPSVTF